MKLRLLPLLIIFSASAANAEPVVVKPELEQFKQKIEAEITKNVTALVGENTRFMLQLQVEEEPPSADGSALSAQAVAASDLAYLPSPLLSGGALGAGGMGLVIKAVTADIQVPSNTDEAVTAGIKEVVERTLKPYPAQVTVGRLSNRSLASLSGPDSATFLNQAFLEKLLLFIVGVIGLIAAFAVGSWALRASFRMLAEGLKSMRGDLTAKLNDSAEVALKGLGTDGGIIGASGILGANGIKPPPFMGAKIELDRSLKLQDYTRNINLVKEILKMNPLILIQSLKDEAADLAGLRALLPNLNLDEQERIKNYMGKHRVELLRDLSTTLASQGPVDVTLWLADFVERIMVQRLHEGSRVQKMLGSEHCISLFKLDPEVIRGIVSKSDDPAVWRVGAEFLPHRHFEQMLTTLSEEEWERLIASARVSDDAVRTAAAYIFEEAPRLTQETDTETAQFYNQTLLGPIVSSVVAKDLGEDDHFLERLSRVAPDFVPMVREKIWTTQDFAAIPDEYLQSYIRSLDDEHKLALAVSLPDDQHRRVVNLLPEGNVRTIIADRANKLRRSQTVEQKRTAVAICRQIFDLLRVQAKEGKFSINRPHDEQSADVTSREAA